jgi:hypothetical protein
VFDAVVLDLLVFDVAEVFVLELAAEFDIVFVEVVAEFDIIFVEFIMFEFDIIVFMFDRFAFALFVGDEPQPKAVSATRTTSIVNDFIFSVLYPKCFPKSLDLSVSGSC